MHGGQTHQNVRNSQSYTFLNSPAMVVEGHAVVEREGGRVEGVGDRVRTRVRVGRKVAQVFADSGIRKSVVQVQVDG